MKNLSKAVISSATEIENMSEKLQAFIESQFRKVSILQRAFLLCSRMKEVTSVMCKMF